MFGVFFFFSFLPVQFIKPVHTSILHMFHTFACKTLYNIFYIQFVKVCMLFKSHLDKIFVTLMRVHCELFLHCCSTLRIAIMFSFMEMLSCSMNESLMQYWHVHKIVSSWKIYLKYSATHNNFKVTCLYFVDFCSFSKVNKTLKACRLCLLFACQLVNSITNGRLYDLAEQHFLKWSNVMYDALWMHILAYIYKLTILLRVTLLPK